MEQLQIINQNNIKTCAFTGHRDLPPSFDAAALWDEIEVLIKQGVEVFYNGMAIGFDMLAAEAVLESAPEKLCISSSATVYICKAFL